MRPLYSSYPSQSDGASRYFTKDGHHGVCIFRRRKTAEEGQRGYRLSSLGILLAKSARPRAWRHVTALKALQQTIYDGASARDALELLENDWEPAKAFYEDRKVMQADMDGAGHWNGWSQELDGVWCFIYLCESADLSAFSQIRTPKSQVLPSTSPISSEY